MSTREIIRLIARTPYNISRLAIIALRKRQLVASCRRVAVSVMCVFFLAVPLCYDCGCGMAWS